jgi:sporulation protein YlmC with PRC-barrel domain
MQLSEPPHILPATIQEVPMKKYITAFALMMALPTAALAQSTWLEIDDDSLMVTPMSLSVDQIEDMDVYTSDGEEVGEVEEVLGTTQGEATALALEVGGFLGIGEREVVVPIDQLAMQEDRIVLDMTKEEIEALEDWAD